MPIIALYAVPYLLAVVMPGIRWLFGYAAACVVLLAVYIGYAALSSTSGDGRRAILGLLPLIILVVPGMISGFFARGLTLLLGSFRDHPISYSAITIAGLIYYPALVIWPLFLK